MIFFCIPSNFAVVYIVICQFVVTVIDGHFHVTDDKVAFQLQWLGKQSSDLEATKDFSDNVLSIVTENEERYQCVLPDIKTEDDLYKGTEINGPSPLSLLKPLYGSVVCTLKVEQFWTYELCHGRFIRQYHKEVTLDEKIFREYILGYFDQTNFKNDEVLKIEKLSQHALNKITVEGKEYPYWGLNMTDGTFCDLNGRKRFAYLMYICYEDGYNEIHSIKETSTCEYEVIVLSPLLCGHPAFRQNSQVKNDINCYAMGDSPIKPLNLPHEEAFPKDPYLARKQKKEELLKELRKEFEEEYMRKKPQDKPLDLQPTDKPLNQQKQDKPIIPQQQKNKLLSPQPQDNHLIDDFLSGKYCLQGGTGWWHYEFCYGNKALQFHEDNGVRTSIILGKWDVVTHILWLNKNPHKKSKKGDSNRQISHMYTGGSFCDETGKNRQVEVRLKCKDEKAHPNSISMYLLEPRPCEYILPVESPILCPLIESANEYGLSFGLV